MAAYSEAQRVGEQEMLRISEERALGLCQAALEGLGVAPEKARLCADSIVFASVRGIDSHGLVGILPRMLSEVVSGKINPDAEIRMVEGSSTTATLDGAYGLGPVIAAEVMNQASSRAERCDLGAVVAFNCNHFGAASYYSILAARRKLIGIIMCNSNPTVAPFGGRERLYGTNPISYAVPVDGRPPVVLDIATSTVAAMKIGKAVRRGDTSIPYGWVMDKSGKPTTNPHAFREGGALLPMGEHKGYGLGLLVEMLTGCLAGSFIAQEVPEYRPGPEPLGQSFFGLAINPAAFGPYERFSSRVADLSAYAHAVAPAEGFDEVMLPGDPEEKEAAQRRALGIPIMESEWEVVRSSLEQCGLDAAGLEAKFGPMLAIQ